MQPPVRLYAVIVVSLVIFMFSWSWNHTSRATQARQQVVVAQPEEAARGKVMVLGPGGPRGVGRIASAAPRPQTPSRGGAATARAVIHPVQAGETLSAIAALYRVPVAEIMRANGMASDRIRAGDRLTIEGAEPLRVHAVRQGDTLWELATRYGVGIEELLAANRHVDAGHLQIGQELRVPPRGGLVVAALGRVDDETSLAGLFSWPLSAPISSHFGPRWGRNHAGIDLAANQGDQIRAARGGEVLLASMVDGYGETVVLKHSDGTRTLYAHASRLLVRAGQQVKQGDVIALVGSTGVSTGPHLHFEIIVNDRPRDPLQILPRRP
jgi:murein DD-endopeptidase MepM/ murein hydrolase activator NlpD